jgi:cysteinyl-tRNA synthetase
MVRTFMHYKVEANDEEKMSHGYGNVETSDTQASTPYSHVRIPLTDANYVGLIRNI